MTSREKINLIFNHKGDGLGAMWTGHPNDNTIPIYAKEWGIEETREAIFEHLEDDCRWITADRGYHHPDGVPLFDTSYGIKQRATLSAEGCFANAETVADIENYPWPKAEYCDFTKVYEEIDKYQDKMVFTGLWSPFFHIVADFFGMENYFIKMYENPEIVEAVTERIVDFYVEANEKFFAGLGDRADVMFFGNDFGTQLDLFISPDNFRKFVMPSFKRLIAVGKKYNKKVMLHSCGSIYRIIPDLIEAGVDVLHPIQAQAKGMSAAELAQYKDDLAFVGGIDAQSFFVNATPEQIKEEVRRVKSILGPSIVISPSHEEILPNVPAANVLAMAQASRE
ncbi:uroporphyrinogen decarboxylase family protein [Paludicola sp. MB14-C6]|uniref:uroporphyrinogen decarboxylase family protein n=1 Tax=Paludihabitans sp. MB14-C6 TaxID=3070656 RepID=UPI0027DD37A0|nr:uroporphyrinogen decarboxylase family protein [Paludicola sp. MB14-C6]WMJ22837.1 uroporphyrinogen decarboxylase family protein [Paludicola sp. MB14-C6]